MRLTRWRPCMTPAAAPAICPSGRRRENLSSASDKNNPLACFRKSEVECSRSDPDRGAYASSRTLDRNAMGATGGLDEPASRARQRRVVLASMPFFPGKTHIHRAKAPQKAPFHGGAPRRHGSRAARPPSAIGFSDCARPFDPRELQWRTCRYRRDGPTGGITGSG